MLPGSAGGSHTAVPPPAPTVAATATAAVVATADDAVAPPMPLPLVTALVPACAVVPLVPSPPLPALELVFPVSPGEHAAASAAAAVRPHFIPCKRPIRSLPFPQGSLAYLRATR